MAAEAKNVELTGTFVEAFFSGVFRTQSNI